VALVHKQRGPVLLAQAQHFLQGRHIPIHAEDPIGSHQQSAFGAGSLPRFHQFRLKVGQVHVIVPEPLGLAQANPVDDRSVVQAVADHCVAWAQQGLKQARVRVEARGEQNAVFGVVKLGNGRFELLVQVLGPANEPHRRHPKAVRLQR